MSVKIKGLDKLKKDIKRATDKIPMIAAKQYKKEVIKNLQGSKKTGKLSRSFRVRVSLRRAVIFSKLPYAAIQNFGGKIKITKKMRGKMWALFKETGLDLYKAIALTKKSHITIPAKHYTKVNQKKLSRDVDVEFNKITKKI